MSGTKMLLDVNASLKNTKKNSTNIEYELQRMCVAINTMYIDQGFQSFL
jgi:hypothetical protein